MSEAKLQCPKCSGAMVQGFLADWAPGEALVATWVQGAPEKSLLGGTHAPTGRSMPVGTYRCASCGYLESYARPEFRAT